MPQVLVYAFHRIVSLTSLDMPDSAARRDRKSHLWCDVCEEDLSGLRYSLVSRRSVTMHHGTAS
jgi:hypothetical protein